MKIDKDKIWTYTIITIMFLYLMLMSFYASGQYVKKDTILHNQFRDYIEWSKEQHKKTLEDFENQEKYQMIYFDKAIIDRKNKRIYLYSSYDLYFAEELGFGIDLYIKPKKKKK